MTIRMTKAKIILLGALILLMLFWRFWSGGGGNRNSFGKDTPPVRTTVATVQAVPHYLNALGSVVPSSDVVVQSRVEGQLLAIHFSEGQRVKEGELLAEIDPRPFATALEEAQGRLAADEAQLANAKRDLDRYGQLSKGDYVARQQYESQTALVRQYQGVVKADKAQVESARLQLEYSRITAPSSGRVGLRNVDVGNQVRVSDSNGLVRITEIEPCDVLFTLPEAQVHTVIKAMKQASGAKLPVQAWDREQKNILARGDLLSIDNRIDTETGTVRLKARFANDDHALFANQFVNIRLRAQLLPDVVTIPSAAVQLGIDGAYVYVLEPEGDKIGIVRRKKVEPGVATAILTVVNKGLTGGEIVVVDGLDRLRDGIKVSVAATMESVKAEPLE